MSVYPRGDRRGSACLRASYRVWASRPPTAMLGSAAISTSPLDFGHPLYALLFNGDLHRFMSAFPLYRYQLGLDEHHLQIVQQGHNFDVDYLLARGTAFRKRDAWGKTYLHYLTAANCLIREGMERFCCVQDKDGLSALMIAAYTGRRDCSFLMRYEAGLQDCRGRTALVYAIVGRKIANVNTLFPLEFRILDAGGRSAASYLLQYGFVADNLTEDNRRLLEEWARACGSK